jgi:hypothetical protein
MDDPLSRALSEAPKRDDARWGSGVAEYRTPECHALGTMLEALQVQLCEAIDVPFFDGGLRGDTTPVVKNGHAELGTTRVIARKRDPAYEATVSVEVHCDHDQATRGARDPGSYLVRARAHVRCDDARGRTERHLVFAVHEIGGALELDAADLRAKIAEAIRSIGVAP